MPASVQDNDMGLKRILSELKKFENYVVKAGILSGSGEVDGVSIVEYATWNENGVAGKKGNWKIPPRPFIKGWADSNKAQIKSTIERLYSQVADGQITASTALPEFTKLKTPSALTAFNSFGDFCSGESTISALQFSRVACLRPVFFSNTKSSIFTFLF